MKKLIKNFLFAGAFVFLIASPVVTVATPQTTFAAANDCEKGGFLGIPPWYRGLTNSTTNADGSVDCTIKSPNETGGLDKFIWKIALNIIELALVLTTWIAVFFILYGGFLFITGGGNASQLEKARKSIISMGAIAITNLIFGLLDGATKTNQYGAPQIEAGDLLVSGLNLTYYIAGIVAVIVIIIAGITYATSTGDSGRITRAKNMILYAVIGIIVLVAAFAITNFVIGRF